MIKIIDKQKEPKAALLDCRLEERQACKKVLQYTNEKGKRKRQNQYLLLRKRQYAMESVFKRKNRRQHYQIYETMNR